MKQFDHKALHQQIHQYIKSLGYKRAPEGLYDPIEYVLDMGGKRLRPVLMLLAYNLYKEDVETVKDSFKEMLEKGIYKIDLFSD